MLAELAHRVLLELFERATTDPWAEPLYRIAADAPDTDRVWDVLAPRRTRRTWRATWNIGDLFADLTPGQRAVHFPGCPMWTRSRRSR
ncbi:hypothetical protein ACFQV2_20735 [Actinokineospora soli]|uniref:Uncharacterized protein n=1 Tax=Actinokineospora soli TaxID=1048753 RepID=A0ABW2TP36_9PSEU